MTFKNKFLVSCAATILFSSLLVGCNQEKGGMAGGMPGGQIPQVTTMEVTPKDQILFSTLPGRTTAYMVAEVRPQVSGILQKRLFTEGSEVKEGEPLYQIDPATYEANLESAKASLANAEAVLDQAQRTAKRYDVLVKTNAISRQAYDDAHAAVKQGEAAVASAKAAVKSAEINLDYTTIRSPISGTAGRSLVTPGALLVMNQASNLTTVQTLDPIYVDLTQASTEMLRLRRDIEKGLLKGNTNKEIPVELILEDGSVFPHKGVLKLMEVSVDQGTGSVTMRAEFPNPERLLLPGMYVRARVPEGVRDDAILVPGNIVQRMQNGAPYVYVVTPDSKLELRPVQTSRLVNNSWLIDSGLKAGEKVVTEGFQKVRPGVPVKEVPPQNEVSNAAAKAGAH